MKNPALLKHAGLLTLVGLSLVIIALVLYWALMDNTWIRSTALPNLALIVAGLIVCGVGLYYRRSITTISSSVFALLFSGAFVTLIFGMTALPSAPDTPQIGQAAPAFTNLNQNGVSVALADLHRSGPALLVFYRGHW